MAVLTVLSALLLAVMSRVLADDFKAWCPKICDWLINRAASRLKNWERARYVEQWQADLRETPGDIAKLFFAAGLVRATRRLRTDNRLTNLPASGLQNITANLRQTVKVHAPIHTQRPFSDGMEKLLIRSFVVEGREALRKQLMQASHHRKRQIQEELREIEVVIRQLDRMIPDYLKNEMLDPDEE